MKWWRRQLTSVFPNNFSWFLIKNPFSGKIKHALEILHHEQPQGKDISDISDISDFSHISDKKYEAPKY